MRKLFLPLLLVFSPAAVAGVFTMPDYLKPHQVSIGAEAELILTNGAGIGGNFRVKHGLDDLMNIHGLIGTGGGPRGFRIGGGVDFDVFPDIEKQPGIGIGTQLTYTRVTGDKNLIEVLGIPYIHKAVKSGSSVLDPFLAVPFGFGILGNMFRGNAAINLGCLFKGNEHLSYVMEFSIAVANQDSAFSGGLVYIP